MSTSRSTLLFLLISKPQLNVPHGTVNQVEPSTIRAPQSLRTPNYIIANILGVGVRSGRGWNPLGHSTRPDAPPSKECVIKIVSLGAAKKASFKLIHFRGNLNSFSVLMFGFQIPVRQLGSTEQLFTRTNWRCVRGHIARLASREAMLIHPPNIT